MCGELRVLCVWKRDKLKTYLSFSSENDSLWVIAETKVTPHDVLQEPDSLRFNELANHIAKDSNDCEEPLVCMANIREARFVQKDLLNNEDCNRLRELRPSLHDPKTQGNNLCRKEEMDNLGVVILLDESADDTQGSKTKVFEGPGL